MESAIHDLVRELTESELLRIPELEAELQLELDALESLRTEPVPRLSLLDDDELLLDPWFFRTEEEIAAIEDDPTARIIEIRITDYGSRIYDGGAFAESAQ
jgi:hypothetical protein